jgi:predicted DNA-binding transcriptional regulator YafY
MPLSQNDCEVMQEAVDMLRQLQDFEIFTEMSDVINKLQDKLAISKSKRKPIIHFDSVPDLKGLKLLTPLYNYIAHKQPLRIMYRSFTANESTEYILHPYLLKEFRNRWFLFGCTNRGLVLYNLALDRIESIEPVDIEFRENPDFDSETFFNDVIGVSKNIKNTPRRVKFLATPEQSHYIMTKPLHPSQKLKRRNADGSCLFEMEVVINFELYSVLMSYGPGVKVIYPRNAVAYMRDKFKECCRMYEKEDAE